MYVPPYVPQPTEIPGNVTTERYLVRLAFIRRVAALHLLSVLAVAGLVLSNWTPPPLSTCLLGLLISLAASSLIRTASRGAKWEPWVSLATLPWLIILLSGTLIGFRQATWPIWAPGIGLLTALAYIFLCGRDLSFVAMFTIAFLASSLGILAIGLSERASWVDLSVSLSTNMLALLYYVYDLGSLLSRRRLGEEAGAVVDLYRDVLNFFGYGLRSIRHWREHRIWSK